MKSRVLIVTMSEIVAKGVLQILNNLVYVEHIKTFSSVDAVVEFAAQHGISTIIIDFSLFNSISHKSICSEFYNLRHKATASHLLFVALVQNHTDNPIVAEKFDFVISMDDDSSRIKATIQQAIGATNGAEGRKVAPDYELSSRECDVLTALAKGLQNKEIADLLNISTHTVISHRKNIVSKTGIKSVAGLTVYALMHNLLSETEFQ